MTRAHYYKMAATCRVSPKDSLMMPPGEVFDLFEIERGIPNQS